MTDNATPSIGSLCKVRFHIDPPIDGCEAERMWVKVTGYDDESGLLTGILDNDPVVRTDLKAGQVVEFEFADVLETWEDDA